MKRLLALLLCVVMVVACFAGCAKTTEEKKEEPKKEETKEETKKEETKEETKTEEKKEEAPAEAKYQDTITIAVNADFSKPDPANTGSIVDRCTLRLAQHNLVEFDAEAQELVPMLATAWEKVDETTWKFTLREGVKFHDGTDFTAEDVVFTMTRGKDAANAKSKLTTTDSVEAIDDYTVVFHMNANDPDLLFKLADPVCAILSKDAFDTMPEEDAVKIGTGPYKYTSWTQGDSVTFDAFPECWQGAPKTAHMVMKYIPEASSRLIALQTGEVDVIMSPPETDIHYIEEDANLSFKEFTGMTLHYLWFNVNVAPFDNKLVRQAVCYALNHDDFVAVTYKGYAIPAYNVMYPLNEYYDENAKTYEYDVEKAKSLLAEAGYPDGFECTLYGTTAATSVSNATLVQSALAEIGITVNVESMESAAYGKGCGHGGTYDFSIDGWGGYAAGADGCLRPVFHSTGATNRCNIEDPWVDAQLDKALSAPTSEERFAAYSELENYLMEEAVWCPLAIGSINIATKASIEGYVAPHGTTQNWRDLAIVAE